MKDRTKISDEISENSSTINMEEIRNTVTNLADLPEYLAKINQNILNIEKKVSKQKLNTEKIKEFSAKNDFDGRCIEQYNSINKNEKNLFKKSLEIGQGRCKGGDEVSKSIKMERIKKSVLSPKSKDSNSNYLINSIKKNDKKKNINNHIANIINSNIQQRQLKYGSTNYSTNLSEENQVNNIYNMNNLSNFRNFKNNLDNKNDTGTSNKLEVYKDNNDNSGNFNFMSIKNDKIKINKNLKKERQFTPSKNKEYKEKTIEVLQHKQKSNLITPENNNILNNRYPKNEELKLP